MQTNSLDSRYTQPYCILAYALQALLLKKTDPSSCCMLNPQNKFTERSWFRVVSLVLDEVNAQKRTGQECAINTARIFFQIADPGDAHLHKMYALLAQMFKLILP